jgi:hypothetical protein
MSDPEHARLMLQLAQDDLTALEELRMSQRISPAIFGFHSAPYKLERLDSVVANSPEPEEVTQVPVYPLS